jgi:DNA-binding MarR family transcriptional regulator
MADTLPPTMTCNCFVVRQAARRISGFYDGHLAASGLRTTQYSVLSHLARLGPLAINALAAAMGADRTTMGRAVRPLEREGLVAIGPGRDGRTRALVLTEAGRRRLEEAQPHWRRAQAAFEAAYGADEAAALRAALGRVPEGGAAEAG